MKKTNQIIFVDSINLFLRKVKEKRVNEKKKKKTAMLYFADNEKI